MKNLNYFKLPAVTGILIVTAAMNAQAQSDPALDLRTDPPTDNIPLDPEKPVEIVPETGNIVIFPADPGSACQGGCGDVQVLIESFSPQGPLEVFQDTTIELSWASRGAWECRVGLDLGPPSSTTDFPRMPQRPSSDPLAFSLDGVAPGTYELVHQCRNGLQLDEVKQQLTINAISAGDCSNRHPPQGLVQDTTIVRGSSRETISWEDLFRGAFPGGSDNTLEQYRIGNDRYASLEFTTTEMPAGASGEIAFNEVTTSLRLGDVAVSISQCPGDFGPAVDDRCRKIRDLTLFNKMFWADAVAAGINDCPIEPDSLYYLNIAPAQQLPNDQDLDWKCDGSDSLTACDFGMSKRTE